VQQSTTAANALQWKTYTQLMSLDREYDFGRFVLLLALPIGDYHWTAEDLHNCWFEVVCQALVKY
jgi:hypothetical protein